MIATGASRTAWRTSASATGVSAPSTRHSPGATRKKPRVGMPSAPRRHGERVARVEVRRRRHEHRARRARQVERRRERVVARLGVLGRRDDRAQHRRSRPVPSSFDRIATRAFAERRERLESATSRPACRRATTRASPARPRAVPRRSADANLDRVAAHHRARHVDRRRARRRDVGVCASTTMREPAGSTSHRVGIVELTVGHDDERMSGASARSTTGRSSVATIVRTLARSTARAESPNKQRRFGAGARGRSRAARQSVLSPRASSATRRARPKLARAGRSAAGASRSSATTSATAPTTQQRRRQGGRAAELARGRTG